MRHPSQLTKARSMKPSPCRIVSSFDPEHGKATIAKTATMGLPQEREVSMFDAGKLYAIEIIEAGGERSFVRGEALDFAGSLLKLLVENREQIYNTSASTFVSVRERKKPSGLLYASGPAPIRNA